MATGLRPHEELAKIDVLGLMTEQSVADYAVVIIKDNRSIFTAQPTSHSLCKLRDAHAVAMTFVANELRVQWREQFGVRWKGKAKAHR